MDGVKSSGAEGLLYFFRCFVALIAARGDDLLRRHALLGGTDECVRPHTISD
jgi:hypothetical protein